MFPNRTKTGLDEFKQKMNEKAEKKEVEPLTFDVTGLGNFRHQVVFAKVAEGPSLERLFEIAGRTTRVKILISLLRPYFSL